MDYNNPFEYEAANKLGPKKILDFYIQDFNYSRLIRSRRNIFLVGERGCGKTMTLLYNSVPVQLKKADKERIRLNLDIICVHIPCNTPLTHRNDYQLLQEFQASVVSEHFLVLSIMYAVVDAVSRIPGLLEEKDENMLREELAFVLGIELLQDKPFFEGLLLGLQREVGEAQKAINAKRVDAFYENSVSFTGGVVPLLTFLRRIPKLAKSHFTLMLDDVHDLNIYQIKCLNSWIAYRDNSLFSFKVATAKVDRPPFLTASGGAILEGHDYTLIDMEQPYQNRLSDFGKLVRDIIQRRLEKNDIMKTSEDFFPANAQFEKEIKKCEERAKKEAKQKFVNPTQKQITDYVYKYARAEYFRGRSRKANLPPYSGFETLVHLSTGVIRNLLEPCYWMYDKVVSEKHSKGEKDFIVDQIPPSVQTDVILERSEKKWEFIRRGLDNTIAGCSREQAQQLFGIFDNLAILFKKRLLKHKSEPRAITFTISDKKFEHYCELEELLTIARKAQLLYTYTSSAKDSGKRETYYVPNRMLWPERGLDPVGQYSHVSIKARHLWAAAKDNKRIPFSQSEKKHEGGLFDNGN